ncbi:MAG: AAA family ATPase, partial [Bacteroidota bacterium]
MHLKETTFNNFRCFIDYPVKYGKQTTVFIGKNGTGKSSMLSGIRRGLSFMFAKPKNFRKNLALSNNAKVKSFDKLEATFDPLTRSFGYPIENEFRGFFNTGEINWSFLKNSMNGGLITTCYNDALIKVLSYYNKNLVAPLPVIAVFADSFPHQKINFGAKVRKLLFQ